MKKSYCIYLQLLLLAIVLRQGSAGEAEMPTSQWQEVTHGLAIDYEHFTESRLTFRILPANQTAAGLRGRQPATVQSAYESQSRSCSGRGALLLHRDLLLSPVVLRLMLSGFGVGDSESGDSSSSSQSEVRYLFFADDKRRGQGASQAAVWTAEWLPLKREINFELLSSAKAASVLEEPFVVVQLCHRLQSRLRLPPEASESSSLLRSPALPLSIGASILSCLLLCLMLWSFASLTRAMKRFQQSLMLSYQQAGWDGSSCASSFRSPVRRIRYNGSVSSSRNCYSSIEARMEHERRMRASYYC